MSLTQSLQGPLGKPRMGRPPSMQNPREQILTRAAALFAQKGYEASSLNDLSALMGLSKPAIYNYFASKQALYDAIILKALTQLVQETREAVDPAADPEAQLRAFTAAHARRLEASFNEFIAMLVGFSGMSPSLRPEALALRDSHERMLREIIGRGADEGLFRAVEPEVVARALLSMLNWMARWFKPGAGKSAEAVAAEYVDLLLMGLMAPKQP